MKYAAADIPSQVKANHSSETGNSQTVTRDTKKRDSGLCLPFFILSRLKRYVCTGTKQNATVTPVSSHHG